MTALSSPEIVSGNITLHPLPDDADRSSYGVGQSILQGFTNASNSMLPATRATMIGYGPCGNGVADTLKSLGTPTSVVDVDPFRALDAIMQLRDGLQPDFSGNGNGNGPGNGPGT